MKVVLSDVASGFNLQAINNNFQTIAGELNNKVLYRANPIGEPDQMIGTDLDMNGQRIINLGAPVLNTDGARLQDVQDAIAGAKTAALTTFAPYKFVTNTNVQGAIQQVVDYAINENILPASYFGIVGDGSDEAPKINTAANTLAAMGGGGIRLNPGLHITALTNITLPPSVWIEGNRELTGTPGNNNNVPYASVASAIRLASTASISISSNSGLKGVLVYRNGMNFPEINSAAFAGTAVTIRGDDAFVKGCQFLGFAKGILSNGFQRPKFESNLFDCSSALEITNCFDIPYVVQNHAWPFVTVASSTDPAGNLRSGIAFNIHDNVDGLYMDGCFAYGYGTNFSFSNISTPRVSDCFSDTSTYTNSIGFFFGGFINGGAYVNCNSWTSDNGFIINTQPNSTPVNLIGGSTNMHTFAGISVQGGNVRIRDYTIQNGQTSVAIHTAESIVDIDDTIFDLWTGSAAIVTDVPTTNLILGKSITSVHASAGTAWVNGNSTLPLVASAGAVNLPTNGNQFTITGTTNFGVLNGGWAGRTVTLIFAGALQVVTGASMRLANNTSFNTQAGSTLTLIHNGTQWVEISRSA